MLSLSKYIDKLKRSSLFKDSFWAVFGNGLGSGLLLIAGILIARYLGKDVYGEYGVVKTNMLYLAGFATFGLGFTSTRYVAKYFDEDITAVRSIIQASTAITAIFSCAIAVLLCVFAVPLADYLHEPGLANPFRFLSVIIVIKALTTTGVGILAGLRDFKSIAINSIVAGVVMLGSCVPLTIYYGLYGSLTALTLSQVVNMVMNYWKIHKANRRLPAEKTSFDYWELIRFTFPVAMQEVSYSVCNWVGILALTKLSTLGEVGLYTASAQWNAIILFLPGLLHNVVLSHLSRNSSQSTKRGQIKQLLLVYLVSTGIPFLLVFIFADIIASFYGPQFAGIANILRVLTFATIPLCCSDVFKSNLLADGHPWLLFTLRCGKDVGFILLVLFMLLKVHSVGGAMSYAIANLAICILFFFALLISYKMTERPEGQQSAETAK